jgi:hypothetical protein
MFYTQDQLNQSLSKVPTATGSKVFTRCLDETNNPSNKCAVEVTVIPVGQTMLYGTQLSNFTGKPVMGTFLSFNSSGAVVKKIYGSTSTAVTIISGPTTPPSTINPTTTYILALRQVPQYNQAGLLTTPGKLGIQVYINGTLKYEKYVRTKRSGDTSPANSSKIVDVATGGIYNDANYAWSYRTGNKDSTVLISNLTPVAGSVIENIIN